MAEIRSIEKAKKRLSKAETSLESSIKKARKSILTLNAELRTSNLALIAAKKRHSQLKNLTRCICDDCWVILPTVRKEVQTAASHTSFRPAVCMNCGGSFSFEQSSIVMPPKSTSILQEADEECRKADDVIKEAKTSRCLRDSRKAHHPDREHCVRRSWDYKAHSESEPESNLKLMQTKKAFLDEALTQGRKIQNQINHLTHALEQWTKYKKQHEEELEKVKAKIIKVADCERNFLETKLEKLGVSKRKRDDLTETPCVICLERQKEIVFQCGHQCCSECSKSLRRCHTCRARITQRIKLFD